MLCPYCAQPLDVFVDPGGGDRQEYVEDCAVCCRPLRIVAQRQEDGEFSVEAFSDV